LHLIALGCTGSATVNPDNAGRDQKSVALHVKYIYGGVLDLSAYKLSGFNYIGRSGDSLAVFQIEMVGFAAV
jgi:hypothetical protein